MDPKVKFTETKKMDPKVKFTETKKMEASTSNDLFAKELEDELIKFTCSYDKIEVGGHVVEQTEEIHQSSDMKVNVTDFSKVGGNEAEYTDTTECSSSFDDSDYGAEGNDAFGNSEVSSHFRNDAESDLNLDGSGEPSRGRKKVSSHWRSFVHPIMWRCKWIELQMKKLEGLAKHYDRKLEEYSRKPTLEGSGINFPQNNTGGDILRRRKRRRVEETNDIATYMSQHSLFSYYENRESISVTTGHVLKNPVSDAAAQEEVDADDESWDHDEQLCVEAGNDNDHWECILQKIDHLQSRVAEMKTRVGKLMSEIAEKSDLTFRMSSPSSSGHQMPIANFASQLLSEHNLGGLLLPESAVTNNGEAVRDASGSSARAHSANPFGNDYDDDILIDNQRVRDEMRYYEEVNIHPVPDAPAPNLPVPIGRRKGAAK